MKGKKVTAYISAVNSRLMELYSIKLSEAINEGILTLVERKGGKAEGELVRMITEDKNV